MENTDASPIALKDRSELVGPFAFVWPEDDDIDRQLTVNNMTPVFTEHEFELEPESSANRENNGP